MIASVRIARTWSDETIEELRVTVSGGAYDFVVQVYVRADWCDLAAEKVATLGHLPGGEGVHLEAGGEETWGAGFRLRLLWSSAASLLVSTDLQGCSFRVGDAVERNRAALFLRTEPALVDRFTAELRRLAKGHENVATLECVEILGAP